MIAAGIDLGGTKIEAQIFDANWACIDRRRVETPHSYDAIVQALADQIAWADQRAGKALPAGIGAAGLINRATGLAYASNLPTKNRPLPKDVEKVLGRKITFINDCRALALSEAVFGSGRGKLTVAGLILGTGVGGGLAIDGRLAPSYSGVGGEFGHFTASAHLIRKYGLPLVECGCGRIGCTETLLSGPGLTRIGERLIGLTLRPEEIAEMRSSHALAALTWAVWCQLLADLMITLVFTMDPSAIVIGGGLSKIPGILDDVMLALLQAQLPGFAIPELLLAEGGDASGARGAAYAALQDQSDG
jgi:N-acetylglucosamine kinase